MDKNLHHSSYNIPVINNLRGVACLMVTLYHFVSQTLNYVESQKIKDLFHYGDHGVQVFFVISGIVIPLSMLKSEYNISNWGRFMLKRFTRLEPPYIVGVCVAIVYFKVRQYIPGTAPEDMMLSTKEIFLHIGYLIPLDPNAKWAVTSLWTLSVEFQYYLLLSLAFPLTLLSLPARMLFYLLFLAMPFTPISGDFLPPHASLFLMGIVFALWFAKKINTSEYAIVSILAILTGFLTLKATHIIVAMVALMVIYFFTNAQYRLLSFFGAISYSLYLTHQAIGTPIINFLSHRFRQDYQKPLVFLCGTLAAIAFAYVMYRVVELPAMRWSKRIRYGHSGDTMPAIQNEKPAVDKRVS